MLRSLAGLIAAGLLTLAPVAPASAQNPFESFFNSLDRALRGPPPPAMTERAYEYVEPQVQQQTVTRAPARASGGPSKAFCVRTCDGHYFPVRAHRGMSVAEACSAFCPASETRIYSGGNIDYARARDGSRYAALKTAYLYRKNLVAGCTCNGRDPFGLARIAVTDDPTLRAGDVVATREGMVAYTGKKKDNFTPVADYARFSKRYRETLSEMEIRQPHPNAADATPAATSPQAEQDARARNHSASLAR